MRTADFDFDLPPERIAQEPARPRDSARLLDVPSEGPFVDRIVGGLAELLAPGDLMICNDTRVIPARLSGARDAVKVEVTLHQRLSGDTWRVFAKPGKRLRVGDTVHFGGALSADVLEKRESGDVTLRFSASDGVLMVALHEVGVMPLPPYIRRPEGERMADRADYQTVFADKEGAVAAPTAGLHFTPDMLAALEARGVRRAAVTLHVGAGTFLPVKVDDIRDHRMHSEWGEISTETASAIAETRARGGRIVAIGTTSLRLLESAVGEDGVVPPFSGETDIFITPGHRFRAVDLLLTNFHLPKSTLFMLVSAFAGMDRMRNAYAHAIATGYRFFSYGDACLLRRAPHP